MANWKRKAAGDLPLYQAQTIAWLPGIIQGFTTRRGGVSPVPYDSLNLGIHVGDSPNFVQENRHRLWHDLGFQENQVVLAEQVHGSEIAHVTEAHPVPIPGVDALMTDTPDLLLALFFADCVPVYVVDPVRQAIGLAHAGWRGTEANVVGKLVAGMKETYGCQPYSCLAGIGPCIAGESYEVDRAVADKFRNLPGGKDAGAATAIFPRNEMTGKYNLNLRQIVFRQLLIAGIRAEYISVCDEDTFRNRRDFFSHRRDGPATGRMAAFLSLRNRTTLPVKP